MTTTPITLKEALRRLIVYYEDRRYTPPESRILRALQHLPAAHWPKKSKKLLHSLIAQHGALIHIPGVIVETRSTPLRQSFLSADRDGFLLFLTCQDRLTIKPESRFMPSRINRHFEPKGASVWEIEASTEGLETLPRTVKWTQKAREKAQEIQADPSQFNRRQAKVTTRDWGEKRKFYGLTFPYDLKTAQAVREAFPGAYPSATFRGAEWELPNATRKSVEEFAGKHGMHFEAVNA